jgi:hypothetical protein
MFPLDTEYREPKSDPYFIGSVIDRESQSRGKSPIHQTEARKRRKKAGHAYLCLRLCAASFVSSWADEALE